MKNMTDDTMYVAQKLNNFYSSYQKFMETNLWVIFVVFLKRDPATVIVQVILNISPKGKSTSDSSLIFKKPFLYLIGSPPFIV